MTAGKSNHGHHGGNHGNDRNDTDNRISANDGVTGQAGDRNTAKAGGSPAGARDMFEERDAGGGAADRSGHSKA